MPGPPQTLSFNLDGVPYSVDWTQNRPPTNDELSQLGGYLRSQPAHQGASAAISAVPASPIPVMPSPVSQGDLIGGAGAGILQGLAGGPPIQVNRQETGVTIGPPKSAPQNVFQKALSGAGNAMSAQRDALAAAVQPLDFAAKQRFGGLQATGDPSIDAATDFSTQQALANMPFLQRLAAVRGQPMNALGQPVQQALNNQAGHALTITGSDGHVYPAPGQAGNALLNMGGSMAVDPLTWETLGLGTMLHGLAAAAPEGSLAARIATAAPRAVSAGFAGQQLATGVPQLYQGIRSGDIGEATQGLVGTAFGGLAGLHAFGGVPTPDVANTPIADPSLRLASGVNAYPNTIPVIDTATQFNGQIGDAAPAVPGGMGLLNRARGNAGVDATMPPVGAETATPLPVEPPRPENSNDRIAELNKLIVIADRAGMDTTHLKSEIADINSATRRSSSGVQSFNEGDTLTRKDGRSFTVTGPESASGFIPVETSDGTPARVHYRDVAPQVAEDTPPPVASPGIQPEQVSALAQNGFTKAADLFAHAKATDPTLTRQQFAQQLYDFHATNAGDGGAFEYEGPSGDVKPKDVFTAQSADGRNIRYYGFNERASANVENQPAESSVGSNPVQPPVGSSSAGGITEDAPVRAEVPPVEPASPAGTVPPVDRAGVSTTEHQPPVSPDIEQGFNLAHYDEAGEAKEALRDYLKTQAAPIAEARGYVSRADTAAAAARNGVTESQLKAAVPGAGAEELNALGNLHDQYFRDWQAAGKAFNESGSDADLRAMTESKLQLDSFTALLAGKEAEAGRSLGALNSLKSAEYAKDPVKAAVAEVMKPVRQGRNAAPIDPTKEGFGTKNTIFEKSAGEAALQRIRDSVKGSTKVTSGVDPTGGKLDNVDVKDLLEAGGYLFEGGIRKFAEWSKGMSDAVGAQLTDGQLQHTWANLRAEFTSRISTKRTSDTFVDQLSQRQGWNRQGAANFVNDIGHDTLNKLLTGEARTPEEEKAIGQAYIDHQKGGPKQGTTPSGTMADVLAARDKVRADADLAAGNLPKEAPSPESVQQKRMQKQIEDLNALLESKTTRTQNRLTTVDTEETMQVRKQLADAQSKYSAMKARIDAGDVDPAVKREADRQQAKTDQLTKRLTEISSKVDAGDTSVKQNNPPTDTPEQAAIRKQIAGKQTQLDAMRKAERDAAKPPKPQPAPPTLQDRFETEMTQKMGKDAFAGFKAQVSPEAYKSLLDGTMTDAHEGEIKQALKDNPRAAPTTPAPELTDPRKAVDEMSKQLADEKRESARQEREAQRAGTPKPASAPKTPEEQSDAFWKRRVGGKLDAFKKEVGPDILRKFQDNTLSAAERRTLGERLLANQEPKVSTPSEASARVSDIVKETHKSLSDQEIDLRRGNTLRDIATSKLLDDSRVDAKRVAAKMAGLDDNDLEGIRKVMREESRTPLSQRLVAGINAGRLSSPVQVLKVIGSHALSLGQDVLSEIPASIADAVIGRGTGNGRTMMGTSLAQMGDRMKIAATQGVAESKAILHSGEDAADIQDLGQSSRRAIFGDIQMRSKIGEATIENISKMHAVGYRVFRLAAFTRAIQSGANLQAHIEGLKGADYAARVKELTDNPTETIAAEASKAADMAVSTQDNAFSDMVKNGSNTLSPGQKAVVKFLIPFSKVPANLAVKTFRNIPVVGMIPDVLDLIGTRDTPGLTKEQQAQWARTLGKQATGAALYAFGAYGASKGWITGHGKQKDGAPPDSILLHGRWFHVGQLAPVGPSITNGASILQDARTPYSSGEKQAGIMAGHVVQGLAENPITRGAETISEMMDGRSFGSAVTKTVAGTTPRLLSDVAATFDSEKRKTDGIGDEFASQIPVLRNRLPSKGQPETRNFYDPFQSIRNRR